MRHPGPHQDIPERQLKAQTRCTANTLTKEIVGGNTLHCSNKVAVKFHAELVH